jgi:uncharacterized protein (DUF1697 family)
VPRYAVLPRGINVGRNKRVAMADLRALLSGLGLTDVRTLLMSGNAVFTGPESDEGELATRIENELRAVLGLDVRCVVRGAAGIRAVMAENPLRELTADGSRFLVLFLSDAPPADLLATHDPTELAPEQIRIGDRVIYQFCPDGVLAAPPVGTFVEKHWGVGATARNWNTLVKLAAIL